MSNVASSHSPAGLPSLTVGTRLSNFVFPIQPPQHELKKKNDASSWSELFLTLLATPTVTLLVGRGTKWLLRCFFHFSRTPKGGRNFQVREKFSCMHFCGSDGGSPSCYSNVCVLFFCRCHVFSMCYREFKRKHGFIELSRSRMHSSITSFQSLEAAWLSHASQVLCMNLQY